ncbi:l-allo-threonine aldolase [Cordyceps fumosorosea ARSEF 2679]|uniref:L-allo-threonine aldolase n=1 Tax=Cordyceps fumosorosea (strain ARSEF 2679) TaxID=1081104 RepID=A0A167RL79_CORFA|nr:l-allo-threonine aldolase [Cordyceps fumosorosea ARSEF 2679]OAA58704.1 l-allo-threonine aldolase [Cordyceps fumosorosea ARSEF 2679]
MASTEQSGGGAWVGAKGAGSLDLRSDVMTVPTPAMLAAVANCSLRDDVFNEDTTTRELEEHVARLAGKEAALFVTSGTMGNQVALRSLLTQPPFGVLADHRGGVSSLTGATVQPVVPKNGTHLTLEDVAEHAVLSRDVHACPTRVISLENTLNGMVMPAAETARIARFARLNGIRLHLDGARLWEAAAAGATPLDALCAPFDTVSLCFSKGLGAPVGSVVVGDAATIRHARWVRKSLGGGMRQPGFIAAAARVAVDETFGAAPDGSEGWLRRSHETARRVEAAWEGRGGKLVHPVHTNMCWVDLKAHGIEAEVFTAACAEEGLVVSGGRLVTHYQIAQNEEVVLPKLERVFDKVLGAAR